MAFSIPTIRKNGEMSVTPRAFRLLVILYHMNFIKSNSRFGNKKSFQLIEYVTIYIEIIIIP